MAAMAAEVSRLGLALHFARRTYSNRFARIRATKSQSEEDPGIYIGNACAGGEGGERRDNSAGRKAEIMAASGNAVAPSLRLFNPSRDVPQGRRNNSVPSLRVALD